MNHTNFDIVKEIRLFYATYDAHVYPNAILLTKEQLRSFYPSFPSDDKSIESLTNFFGLKIIFSGYPIPKPRLIKI
jgi:hypothetical protein